MRFLPLAFLLLAACEIPEPEPPAVFDVPAHYTKAEYQIPMRDGVTLYTAVYTPKDTTAAYPFLIKRSPYSSPPYGPDAYPTHLGPVGTARFAEEGYLFVYQDVRGRFMSEGQFLHMTPHRPTKTDSTHVDESTDLYDTVDWLLENVPHHNGRAGLWGISYPGFYAAASIIDTHPAVRASSPQAPIGDWFIGDDFHHKGAFYLQDAFGFFTFFESPAPNPTTSWGPNFAFNSDNAYTFYKDLGALRNANERYLHHNIAFWDSMMAHGTYDDFWQRRNIIPHLNNINTNVMTVAGTYDAEDPYGPIAIYQSIEEKNPGINNTLVLGPWFHGGWVRSDGSRLGNVHFNTETGTYYQENVDLPFFNYHLKDKGTLDLPEVLAYASGGNQWYRFDAWPPPQSTETRLYLAGERTLSEAPPTVQAETYDQYTSDPADPVPYTGEVTIRRTREYMVEDQRFAASRPDVLTYEGPVLTEDDTWAGPISVHLYAATTGTDADFIIKVIDVYPDDAVDPDSLYLNVPMAGYQMLVRGEVMRAKFRNSYTDPEPMVPGEVTEITFDTPDVFHTFKAGHRIVVHLQSSWFPLVDMNPQQFLDIYQATDADFQKATLHIHRSADHPSHLRVRQLTP